MNILESMLSIIASILTILLAVLQLSNNTVETDSVKELIFLNIKFNTTVIQYIIILIVFSIIVALGIITNKKRKSELKFLNFVRYLFYKKLDILAKMCLELDSTKKYNNLKIYDLLIEYTYNIDKSNLNRKSDIPMNIPVNINYELDVENLILPNKIGIYNMESNDVEMKSVNVYQKHGNQNRYTEMSQYNISKIDSKIEYYYCKFDRRYRKKTLQNEMDRYNVFFPKKVFKIFFKIDNLQKKLLKHDRIVIYPKQFGKNIRKITLKIIFPRWELDSLNVITNEISETKGKFDIISLSNQEVKSDYEAIIELDVGKTEHKVYYIDVSWEYRH